MLAYDVQLKGFNKLDVLAQRLIIPLQETAVVLAQSIRKRVMSGVSASGGRFTPLGGYSTTGRGKDPDNRWWVRPGQPQPGGYERKITEGEFQGWAVYENYERYVKLLPGGDRRDWDKTGSLWRSLGVKAMAANRVKISFYGSRGKGTSQAGVAYLAGRKESASVLQYNDAEREAFVVAIKGLIDEDFAKKLGEASAAGRSGRSGRRPAVSLGR